MSLRRVKIVALSLLVAFITLSTAISYFAFNVPELKVHSAYEAHEPISIDGDDDLADLDYLVNGSGTEDDPYIMEWISIVTPSDPALQINNTDSYIVIRHSSFGSSVRVAEDSPTGIRLRNTSHVRVEDSMFRYLGAGVSVDGLPNGTSADILVSHCVFTSCGVGIDASHTDHLDIESCSMQFMKSCPISLAYCNDCKVSLNRILQGGCVAISNCSGIQIHHNSVHDGTLHALDSVDVEVSNNSIRQGDWYALKVARSSVVLVADNMMEVGSIYLNRSDSCDVRRNTVTGVYSGISGSFLSNSTVSDNVLILTEGLRLWYVDNCSVSDNTISGRCARFDSWNFRGLGVRWGSNTVISNNIVEQVEEEGISVSGSNLTIKGNIVRDIDVFNSGMAGIGVYSCSWLTVADNSISNISSFGFGLRIWGSSQVVLVRNNITNGAHLGEVANSSMYDNSFIGPAMFYFISYGSSNLTIFRNSFMGIDVRGPDGYEVSWNEDYPTGGNYWSEYGGSDEYSGPDQDIAAPDGDGIGDEPYVIDSFNVDRYPLMERVEIDDMAPPVTYASVSGLAGNAGWYRSDLNVTLVSLDGCSGVDTTHFRLDGGPWQTYTEIVSVVGDGRHVLEFYSVDRAGNSENVTWREYNIDSQPPIPVIVIETQYRFEDATQGIVTVDFTDDLSGVSEVWGPPYYVGYPPGYGNFVPPKLEIALGDYDREFDVWTRDMAGNEASLRIYVESYINYDREPFSPTGPYGPFLIIALLCDIGLLIALFVYYEKWERYGFAQPWRRTDKEPWQRDKAHDVEDGYSKHIKRQ